MAQREVDEYIRQTLAGIIPKDLWEEHQAGKTDPFKDLSPSEARKVKRKFRKIKRKSNVGGYNTFETMWRKINSLLDEQEL